MTIQIQTTTTGITGMSRELILEERKRSRRVLSKASAILAKEMRTVLSTRGGPAPPGSPPAKVEGFLRASIGRDRPRRKGEEMSVIVGVGVGTAKTKKVKADKLKGVNVFDYAVIHEHGGIGAGGRRVPPRPFARVAEARAEGAIVALLEADE